MRLSVSVAKVNIRILNLLPLSVQAPGSPGDTRLEIGPGTNNDGSRTPGVRLVLGVTIEPRDSWLQLSLRHRLIKNFIDEKGGKGVPYQWIYLPISSETSSWSLHSVLDEQYYNVLGHPGPMENQFPEVQTFNRGRTPGWWFTIEQWPRWRKSETEEVRLKQEEKFNLYSSPWNQPTTVPVTSRLMSV